MKVNLGRLWASREVLHKVTTMKFKARTSYRLMKMIDQVNNELEPFGKARQELFLKYGDQDGDRVTIKKENTEAFMDELKELEAQEVELKFSVSLEEIEEAELTPADLYAIDFLFADANIPAPVAVPQ